MIQRGAAAPNSSTATSSGGYCCSTPPMTGYANAVYFERRRSRTARWSRPEP